MIRSLRFFNQLERVHIIELNHLKFKILTFIKNTIDYDSNHRK